MGINLTLCPVQFDNLPPPVLLHNRLSLDLQNYDLFNALKDFSTELDDPVLWYEDDGLKERSTDPYGDPLSYVTAFQFSKCWSNHKKGERLSDWDTSCISFIQSLRQTRQVVLWFH